MYLIKMMSGETYKVNQSEYQGIMKAEKGMFLPRLEVYINKSSISTAYPESLVDEVIEKKNQMTGVLHDGTRVKKHFGEWVIADGEALDDKGNYQPIKLDPHYYPEVARDCVATESEFNKMLELKPDERLKIMTKKSGSRRNISDDMEGLNKILQYNAMQRPQVDDSIILSEKVAKTFEK